MSQFSAGSKAGSPSSSPPNDSPLTSSENPFGNPNSSSNVNGGHTKEAFRTHQRVPSRPLTPPTDGDYHGHGSPLNTSPKGSPHRHKRSSSRPLSMVQTYQPRIMDVNEDTIPELLPIFSYLNSHSNKLYHEGYFLKLDDQNSRKSPARPPQLLFRSPKYPSSKPRRDANRHQPSASRLTFDNRGQT